MRRRSFLALAARALCPFWPSKRRSARGEGGADVQKGHASAEQSALTTGVDICKDEVIYVHADGVVERFPAIVTRFPGVDYDPAPTFAVQW